MSNSRKPRPRSGVLPREERHSSKADWKRPKSAGISIRDSECSKFKIQNQWLFDYTQPKTDDKTSAAVSVYTNSSFELLLSLIGKPIVNGMGIVPIDELTESNRFNSTGCAGRGEFENHYEMTICTEAENEESVGAERESVACKWRTVGENNRPSEQGKNVKKDFHCECSIQGRIESTFRECQIEIPMDSVKWECESESSACSKKEKERDSSRTEYIGNLGKATPRGIFVSEYPFSTENISEGSNEATNENINKRQAIDRSVSSEREMAEKKNPDQQDLRPEENETNVNAATNLEILNVTNSRNHPEVFDSPMSLAIKKNYRDRTETPLRPENSEKTSIESTEIEGSSKLSRRIDEGVQISSKNDDSTSATWDSTDSTYEEIISLLQRIDSDDTEIRKKEVKLQPRLKMSHENPSYLKKGRNAKKNSASESAGDLKGVYSFLEEMEKGSEALIEAATTSGGTTRDHQTTSRPQSSSCPRLEQLVEKNSIELAHEVFSLKIQLEDQKKGIKLLRETIAELKKRNAAAELEHREAVNKANGETEGLIRRHQKFIKQLLNEKKNLNETVAKLVRDLKSEEEKFKKNMKAIEERHNIEIKRAREAQAAADKIKREKWMESKTRKIKEMTVKGLEPELSRMVARQQQEINELKAFHGAELEAVELKAARRTSELMDQLRMAMTREKSNAINKETNNLRTRMEKGFEEERNRQELIRQRLKDQIRKEEEKLADLDREFRQKLTDQKRDGEVERQKMARDFQEKLEEARQRHGAELKNLRESLEGEREIWMRNYKKQESARFVERESELHQRYKRERDRDIEVVIEMLEKESARIQLELNESMENKMKRLREKFEKEIKEAEANESRLRDKLSQVKSQLLAKEELIVELDSRIRQQDGELIFLRKVYEEMKIERNDLKSIIRKEFESDLAEMNTAKENLVKEISILKKNHTKELAKKDQINVQVKNEMQRELAKVYARIKTAANKKEIIIETLMKENKETMDRCHQLELLLENQRKNLLLQ